MIEVNTVYNYRGNGFKTLEQVETAIENEIGKVIDSVNWVNLEWKDRLNLLRLIKDNHREIHTLIRDLNRLDDIREEE